MAVISSLFFALSLILAVLLGPQTHPWPWGPALISLGLAVLAAVPCIWRGRSFVDTWLVLLGFVVMGWFGWRAAVSPVEELRTADLLLLCGAIGSFIAIRVIAESEAALRIFLWSLALLLLASVVVLGRQVIDPSYNPIFPSRPAPLPAGFFGHYNEGANFLMGASFLIGTSALIGRHATLTRVIWGLIAVSGMIAVYFTRSRSGILSVSVGAVTFLVMLLLYGKRQKSGWFAPLMIGAPFALILAVTFVGIAWMKAQEARSYEGGIEVLMDNNIRLFLAGIAMSCIGLHPWAGGGSRSYSWECYQFWGVQENGWTSARPEQVHNELLQALTDYGIIGGVLLFILFGAIILSAVLRTLFNEEPDRNFRRNAACVGGIASLCAMLTHANFNFGFHLLPGSMLLGLCMGYASIPVAAVKIAKPSRLLGSKIGLTVLAIALAAMVLPLGWKGCRVTNALRANYFKHFAPPTAAQQIDSLRQAIHLWPQAVLYKERAILLHKIIREDVTGGLTSPDVEEAIACYQAGLVLHPFEVQSSVNLANLLSLAGRDEEAEKEYERAIRLQGGMELGFKAHLYATNHLLKVGKNHLRSEGYDEALESFSKAAAQYGEAVLGWPSLPALAEGIDLKASIDDGIGLSKEGSGDLEGALEIYDQLAKSGRSIGNYRAGVLLGKMADSAYSERRSSEALTKFLAAKARLNAATEISSEVNLERKNERLAYYEQMIEFFAGAKVEPLPETGK